MSYHQLGRMAWDRGQLAEAEAWYKKSLVTFEALDDKSSMAKTLAQLSNLRGSQGDLAAALRFAVHGCALFEEFPNQPSTAPKLLALYWRFLGREAVAAAWREVADQDMPAAIPEALDALVTALAEEAANATGGTSDKPADEDTA